MTRALVLLCLLAACAPVAAPPAPSPDPFAAIIAERDRQNALLQDEFDAVLRRCNAGRPCDDARLTEIAQEKARVSAAAYAKMLGRMHVGRSGG